PGGGVRFGARSRLRRSVRTDAGRDRAPGERRSGDGPLADRRHRDAGRSRRARTRRVERDPGRPVTGERVLVVNVGSTSLKYAVFDAELEPICRGRAAGVFAPGSVLIHDGPAGRSEGSLERPALEGALDAMLAAVGSD